MYNDILSSAAEMYHTGRITTEALNALLECLANASAKSIKELKSEFMDIYSLIGIANGDI